MPDLDLPSAFVDEATFLSADDLELLRQAAVRVDGLSYRSVVCFDSTASHDTGTPGQNPRGDFRMWWGTLEWSTGMTTLTWVGSLTRTDTESLRLYINGVLKDTVSTNGAFSRTVSIASGYADGDLLDLLINVEGHSLPLTPASKVGTYQISDIYASPVTVAATWPGVPAFTTTYPAAKLNQLISAAQWLFDRMNAVPMMPGLAHIWAPATHKVETRTLQSSWVLRDNSSDILRVSGYSLINNVQEQLKIYVNGSLAYTSPTWTLGSTNTIYVPIALTHTIGTRAEVRLDAVILDASNQDPNNPINSRYRIDLLRSEAPSGGYPVQTPPAAFAGNASISQAALTTELNAIATMLSTTYTRITTDTALWGRRRAVRRRYAYDDHQNAKLAMRYVHWGLRRGDRLHVKGKGVSVGWGGINLATDEKDGVVYDKYTFGRNQSITSGEAVETVDFDFESVEALGYGTAFYVYGPDVLYVGEYLI